MSKFAIFLVGLVGLISFFGYQYFHRDDERLRMDNLHWRTSGAEIENGASISPQGGVLLSFSLRGCKPDSSGMCKAEFRVDTKGPGKVRWEAGGNRRGETQPLEAVGPVEFRKRSAITSLEMSAVGLGFEKGSYECSVTCEDLKANKIVQNTIQFTVP